MKTDMGINRYAPKLAVAGDMGWIPGTMHRNIQTLRYWNRLICHVFLYDYNSICEASWCSHIRQISRMENMNNL